MKLFLSQTSLLYPSVTHILGPETRTPRPGWVSLVPNPYPGLSSPDWTN